MRVDGRRPEEFREIRITRGFTKHPPGSVLIESGETKVLCTAMVEESVPSFLFNSGRGWVTAEYSMLPGSTPQRKSRDGRRGQIDGRTQEIQRFIGRSLRSVVDAQVLGERTIWIDCDVLQADGGTRTTAINGAYVALVDCLRHLVSHRTVKHVPITGTIAAISVGCFDEGVLVDLCYEEDTRADVDMNVVMNDKGEFIEIQGVAEGAPFGETLLRTMLDRAKDSIRAIMEIQDASLKQI